MDMYIIDFTPPMENLDGAFNTFRLGGKWAKVLEPGARVILADGKESRAIGLAEVISVVKGKLCEVAAEHACYNHNQRGKGKREAADALMENMRRRYGPHIAQDNKLTTVIYLRRLE